MKSARVIGADRKRQIQKRKRYTCMWDMNKHSQEIRSGQGEQNLRTHLKVYSPWGGLMVGLWGQGEGALR